MLCMNTALQDLDDVALRELLSRALLRTSLHMRNQGDIQQVGPAL